MSLSLGKNLGLLVDGAEGEEHYDLLMKQWRGFDALVMPHVQDKDLTAPPAIVDGAMYIIPAGATGVWAGRTGQIARAFSIGTGAPAWQFFVPKKGWSVLVEDEGDPTGVPLEYRYTGTEWKKPAPPDVTAMQNPMTTAGDIIAAGAGGEPIRVGAGSEGQILRMISGMPTWDEDNGGTTTPGMTNPMSAIGDIIYAGAGGAPTKLARGENGQVLGLVGGVPAWVDPEVAGGGMANPMTTAWDIIVGGTAGAPGRLAKGGDGQVLKMVGGSIVWADESGGSGGGMTNPMTTAGDIITGGTGGAPVRLPKGTDGQVLKMVAGVLAWAAETAAGMANPMTTAGDIIVGGTSGAPTRLSKGTDGQVLKMVAGALAWAAETAGGMANPMTTAGDIIVGGASGAPARLGKGADGQVLKMVAGALAWAAESGGGGGGPANTDELAEGSTNLYFTAARVLATVLTGLTLSPNSVVQSTDTVLQAIGKLQAQVTSRVQNSAVGVSIAQLVGGTVPSSQLPSYVDDVLEYANSAAFPATGETGKIYVALDTNQQYRWSGTIYVQLVSSPGTTDNVPEGTTNLYLTGARVIASALTGLSTSTNSAVVATDTILQAIGKLQAQTTARLPLAGGQMTGAVLQAPPVNVASAATTNIASTAAETINVTGTTTITAFSTAAAGIRKRVVFGGILTLTHGPSSLILPGFANITTAAGDVAEMESLGGGNWKCVSYTKVNGRQVALGAVIPTITAANTTDIYAPGVDVVKVSGTTGIGYLGSGTDGQEVTVVFTGATPLYASASVVLPGGANMTSAAGDVARFVYEGAGVTRCEFFTRAADSVDPLVPLDRPDAKNTSALGVFASTAVSGFPASALNSINAFNILSQSVQGGGWAATLAATSPYVDLLLPFAVVIGDSLAEGHPALHGRLHPSGGAGYTPTYASAAGQPNYELSRLTSSHWYNHGIGSQTSTDVLARFDRDALGWTFDPGDGRGSSTLSGTPYACLVMCGANDITGGISATVTKANFMSMLTKLKTSKIIPIFCTVAASSAYTTAQRAAAIDLNAWMTTTLAKAGAHIFDLYAWGSDGGTGLRTGIFADTIHPTRAGYAQLAKDLLSAVPASLVCGGIRIDSKVDPVGGPTGWVKLSALKISDAAGSSIAGGVGDDWVVFNPRNLDFTQSPSLRLAMTAPQAGVSGISGVHSDFGRFNPGAASYGRGVLPVNGVVQKNGSGVWLIPTGFTQKGLLSISADSTGVTVTTDPVSSYLTGLVGSAGVLNTVKVAASWGTMPATSCLLKFGNGSTALDPTTTSVPINTYYCIMGD